VNGFSSKIVTEEELLSFLGGWGLVQQLADGRLLLRKPAQVAVEID
jgi:hypothetical protein